MVRRPPGVILLIPSAREFDRGLRRGIVEYANAHGPWVFYDDAPAYLQNLTMRQRLRNMREWDARGMIVLESRLQEVRRLCLPAVVAVETRRLSHRTAQILCANEEIGRLGAATLLALGLRRFAYCGLRGLEFSDNRGLGFSRALRAAGFTVDVYSPPSSNLGLSWYAERSHLARWLSALPKPAGLMACNDDRAAMVCGVCRTRGIRVPDQIALLGVDDDQQICKSASPPLSSIALATARAGYEAAALLDRMMRSGRSAGALIEVLPVHAVARQSTDILAVNDPAVSRALRLARENPDGRIRVSDLAAAAGLSRRVLQARFQQHLNRSPIEEIHRCRAERIAHLLIETGMSVGEIAATAGFGADAHLARFFTRRTGMTPVAYRKRHRM